eukprot:Skav203603  [mRNA]  locus=scaffold935:322988:327867:+ [translate_table: standard]
MSPPSRAAVELPPVEGGHLRVEGRTLRAATALGFGALVLREPPLLRVPGDVHGFLRGGTAPAVFAELAERLGDAQRLAAFAAFLKLSQTQQESLLDLGLPPGSRTLEASRKAVSAFLRDFPEQLGSKGRQPMGTLRHPLGPLDSGHGLGQKGLRNAENIKRRLGQLLEQMSPE